MKRRKPDPITVARLKRGARCPDCPSIVRVDLDPAGLYRVGVRHDDDCPALRRLRATGRTYQTGIVQPGGVPWETFRAEAVTTAAKMSEQTAEPVRLMRPYDGLHSTG